MPNVKVVCDNCGKDFYKKSWEIAKTDHNFCSRICRGGWGSKHLRGEDASHWKGGLVTKTCKFCGNELQIPKSHVRFGEGVFCSRKCMGKWMSNHLRGENSHRWKGGPVTRICKYCGEEFQIQNSLVCNGEGIFCSMKCHGKWDSEHRVGENHPGWKGGFDSYYGTNWNSQRRKALERDGYQCQVCGKTGEELPREPDVHHIIPLREFDTPEEANTLDNLITLCQECHGKGEGRPRKQLSQLLASPDVQHIQPLLHP